MNEGKYIWSVGDHEYVLVPEVRVSPHKIWLLGAGMWSLAGEYIGYWSRRQMPLRLVRDLTLYWKHQEYIHNGRTTTIRRNSSRRSKKR